MNLSFPSCKENSQKSSTWAKLVYLSSCLNVCNSSSQPAVPFIFNCLFGVCGELLAITSTLFFVALLLSHMSFLAAGYPFQAPTKLRIGTTVVMMFFKVWVLHFSMPLNVSRNELNVRTDWWRWESDVEFSPFSKREIYMRNDSRGGVCPFCWPLNVDFIHC